MCVVLVTAQGKHTGDTRNKVGAELMNEVAGRKSRTMIQGGRSDRPLISSITVFSYRTLFGILLRGYGGTDGWTGTGCL